MDFVEGEVDDVSVDIGGYQRVGSVTLRYVTIRLKLSEDRFIDVRFKGYTGPITIVRGHKIRAHGHWIKDNIFKAVKIEDLTTGEWWEAKSIKPIYIVLIGFVVFFLAFIVVLINMFYFLLASPEYFIIIITLPFLLLLIAIIYPLYRMNKSYKVIS